MHDIVQHPVAASAVSAALASLVKAANPDARPEELIARTATAEQALRATVRKSFQNPYAVARSLNPTFVQEYGLFLAPLLQEAQKTAADVTKDFTLTSPLASGLVPFDLVAPSRLIYPVYSPLRNKLPRVPGQGTARRAKVLTAIGGSQTGVPVPDIAIGEFPAGQSTGTNWPMQLPPSDTPAAVDLIVPYKFFGRSQSLSWLAQFAGQGFEDIAALANLVLLQEFMLAEEYAMLAHTSQPLPAPGAPTLVARAAQTGETPLSGVSTNVYVRVTATNYYGETVPSASTSVAVAAGQVVDVIISPVPGALQYNLYVATGTADPGASASRLMASGVGATRYTLQGALPTTGPTPPTADTGTGNPQRMEGIIPTLAGRSAAAGVYPAGWQAAYINQTVADTLNTNVVATALAALWSGPGAFRADPAELVCEGSDAKRLSDDIYRNGQLNYRLFVSQDDNAGVRAGAAVTEIMNPVTRSIVRITVHPWLPQGTAMLLSYTLPQSWSNVANVWEMTLVQDYLSVAWPVIDASFRYSLFMYGALVCYAPQYCGLLQGLQRTNTAPYS